MHKNSSHCNVIEIFPALKITLQSNYALEKNKSNFQNKCIKCIKKIELKSIFLKQHKKT